MTTLTLIVVSGVLFGIWLVVLVILSKDIGLGVEIRLVAAFVLFAVSGAGGVRLIVNSDKYALLEEKGIELSDSEALGSLIEDDFWRAPVEAQRLTKLLEREDECVVLSVRDHIREGGLISLKNFLVLRSDCENDVAVKEIRAAQAAALDSTVLHGEKAASLEQASKKQTLVPEGASARPK